MAENTFLTAGSTVMAPLRGMTLAADIGKVAHSSISVGTGAAGVAQTTLSWLATALFAVYYVLSGARYGWGLVQWVQGRNLRKELLQSENPVKMMQDQLNSRVRNLNLSTQEYKQLALDAGAQWMERVADEAQASGIELGLSSILKIQKLPLLGMSSFIQK
jgi:hypothetical protein